jgi:hypothetical protein
VSEPNFTPGPWTLTKFDQGFMIHDADGNLVETVYTGEANARLIAAAPDLYAALKRSRALLSSLAGARFSNEIVPALINEQVALIDAALAKASKP